MAEILTKEIGTNQIAASFNKVKEYYLFSKENKESILKAVENEFFDGYSFQDVKDYYRESRRNQEKLWIRHYDCS